MHPGYYRLRLRMDADAFFFILDILPLPVSYTTSTRSGNLDIHSQPSGWIKIGFS